ncbi:conserved hypothetical protein, truncated [Streptococcus thermophilus LMG 18311]|uniref:Uncharacterized protein n=1 Tax=Streptococcus thermophilus (strain ATCC BAA-250 / LMG 18311) TaxID=264199 RepID=Q5M4M6_STRT2|nr:conserved hypothetical protein, truncated [Streptococcus thermophilus LMG 18311]CAD0127125.1 conserved protein of unknown function [Streptococcus thermophilus]
MLEKASQILPKKRLFLSHHVVSPHVTQVMSWQYLNNGLKSNKVKKSLRNSLANRYFYSLLSKTKSLHSCEGFLC